MSDTDIVATVNAALAEHDANHEAHVRLRECPLCEAKYAGEGHLVVGWLRALVERCEAADTKLLDALECVRQVSKQACRVYRIQKEFADDLGDRDGNIYEQFKDFREQFYAERAEREALRQRCESWQDSFRALVGEDRPDTAGNAVIRLQRDLAAAQDRIKALEAEARAWRDGVETIRAAFGFTVGGPSAPVEIADAIRALEAERDSVIVQRDTAHRMCETLLLYAVPKPEADAREEAAFRAGRRSEFVYNEDELYVPDKAWLNFKATREQR